MFKVSHEKVVKDRLYLIEFKDSTGYYVKCGKSSGVSSNKRFLSIMESYVIAHKGNCAYAKILRDVEVTEVFKRETEFHHRFAGQRHYPFHSFSGSTELFTLTQEEALLAFDEIVGKQYDRSLLKTCYRCKETKSTIMFHTNKAKSDGLNHECKTCVADKMRSFKALPYRIYCNQVEHSKMRGHPTPQYTFEDFKKWIIEQDSYKIMYEQYKSSGYDKNLVPSVDRLNSDKPYSFDNIELVTFAENMRRHGLDRQKSTGNPVYCIDKNTGQVISEFISQNAAATALGINSKGMCKKVDTVVTYGWLATCGNYQFVSVKKANKFIRNGWLIDKFKYAPK